MQVQSFHLNTAKFYSLSSVIKQFGEDHTTSHKIDDILQRTFSDVRKLEQQRFNLARANNAMHQEIRSTTKRNPLSSFEEQEMDFDKFRHTLSGQTFLMTAYKVVDLLLSGYSTTLKLCEDLKPESLITSSEPVDLTKGLSFEKLQQLSIEKDINSSTIEGFVSAVLGLDEGQHKLVELGNAIGDILDSYYQHLLNRHTVEGVEVYNDPIVTDVAMSIFENIDAHGEIESGKDPDEISAYSVRKAEIIIGAINKPNIQQFIQYPEQFVKFIVDSLDTLWRRITELKTLVQSTITTIKKVMNQYSTREEANISFVIQAIKDINPHSIVHKEKEGLLTSEEKHTIKFRNETLKEIVKYISQHTVNTQQLIRYVLQRKSELKKFYQEENSFYICRIGAGNSFLNQAPGELIITPGTKPNVTLDDIIGAGFDEVREFIATIESAAQWHDLFVATSPSKTADKSNMLLIGPQGSGKTEVMRAVATDRGSIAVFAQGSDFLTCWKGEAEKNPKRLFEGALKLQKESNKYVHILIDEADSVMKKQELTQHGEINLTLEFQILMDGVVEYPRISVMAATNNPDRIPMPMIRRFSSVLIVGELDINHRKKLLKQFSNYLPVGDFPENAWENLASKLEGATGDVIRKVVDHVWRTKMTSFVRENPKAAAELVDYLNQESKFEIKNFDDKTRHNFKNKLKPHVKLEPSDLERSVEEHLKNVAIYNEIKEAKETYSRAKEFVSQVEGKKLIV